ncbi:MAG: peroxidase-related enzyme, partial [Candidatus Acidiferrum sp.]
GDTMAHIQLPEGLPGIVGPLAFSPETAKPLLELAEILLRSPNTLTSAEREMIAAHVSYRNECDFCQLSHSAAAAAHLNGNHDLVEQIKVNPESAAVSEKLKALLRIAGKVQQGGKQVSAADVERARREGATDKEIHDTVLIAAAFCMFNRYVDGLATWQPQDPDVYREIGQHTARLGYVGRDYKKPLEAIAAKQGSSRKVASS